MKKILEKSGKIREFCQSGKVATMYHLRLNLIEASFISYDHFYLFDKTNIQLNRLVNGLFCVDTKIFKS